MNSFCVIKDSSSIFDVGVSIDFNYSYNQFPFVPFKNNAVVRDFITVTIRMTGKTDDITF